MRAEGGWEVEWPLQGQRLQEYLEKGRNPGSQSSCLHAKPPCRLLLVLGFLCLLSNYLLKRIGRTELQILMIIILHYGITFSGFVAMFNRTEKAQITL